MKIRTPSAQRASAMGLLVVLMLLGGTRLATQQPGKEAALSPQEKQGEMHFFQKCSICHLPPLVGPGQSARLPFGPLLYGFMDNARNETRVRQVIRNGGAQMPGFQYGLQPAEIEDVVAYLKSPAMKTPPAWFTKAQTVAPGAGRGGGNPVD